MTNIAATTNYQQAITGLTGRRPGLIFTSVEPDDNGTMRVLVLVEHAASDRWTGLPRDVHGLPLHVETCERIQLCNLVPGHEPIPSGEYEQVGDASHYRPLRGGVQVHRHINESAYQLGTLGFFVNPVGEPNVAYAVTNYHVMYRNPALRPPDMRVGQPRQSEGSSGCCNDIIGRTTDFNQCFTDSAAADDAVVDVALVAVDAGQRWRPEIEEIGIVRGAYTITSADSANITAGRFHVRKRGRTTGLTGGILRTVTYSGPIDIGNPLYPSRTCTNLLRIEPHRVLPPPSGVIIFGARGDSGSAVVDDAGRVIGLFVGSVVGGALAGHGIAFPIDRVLSQLNAMNGGTTTFEVSSTDHLDDERIVPSASPRTPARVSASIDPAAATATERHYETVRAQIAATPRGASLLRVWERHSPEVRQLLARDRRFAARWRRSGAPEVVQMLSRSTYDGRPIPAECRSGATDDCMRAALDLLSQYGSPSLRADISSRRDSLPSIAGRSHADNLKQLENGW